MIGTWPVETHHIVPQNACKSAKLRCAELMLAAPLPFMSPSQGHLRTSALVMATAFPHHAAQEKAAADAWARALPARIYRNGERRGGERGHCRRDRGKDICRSRRPSNHQLPQQRILR